jgi:mRNA interferase YafQ
MSVFLYETSRFKRHMRTMPERLALTKDQARVAINEIVDALDILQEQGTLPPEYGYQLHMLEREPWTGFMEFHALDDVLVVYAGLSSQGIIRLIGVYNHELLAKGQFD